MHYDPLNYHSLFTDGMPDMNGLSSEERKEVCTKTMLYGCFSHILALLFAAVVLVLVAFLTGCSAPRTVEQHHHHTYEADTLAVRAQVDERLSSWQSQMDSSWRQSISQIYMELKESSQEKELVTETVTTATDSLGRTLRTEQRTISRDISRQQQLTEQRLARELDIRISAVIDSIDGIWKQRFDSLSTHSALTDSTDTIEKPAPRDNRPWYRRWASNLGFILLGAIVAPLAFLLLRRFFRR